MAFGNSLVWVLVLLFTATARGQTNASNPKTSSLNLAQASAAAASSAGSNDADFAHLTDDIKGLFDVGGGQAPPAPNTAAPMITVAATAPSMDDVPLVPPSVLETAPAVVTAPANTAAPKGTSGRCTITTTCDGIT